MNRNFFLYMLMGCIWSSVCIGEVSEAKSRPVLADQASIRILAKYATAFRLIPTRVSQMLQVVNAYPEGDAIRRTDLIQAFIERLHGMYRIVQQLHNRVLELKEQSTGVGPASLAAQCSLLIGELKKYHVTLISTLSVLDSEFVRSLKRSRVKGASDDKAADSAYAAAKAVLKHNQMDMLIESLSLGESGVGGEVVKGSVKSELRELRDQVSMLSAQLQSKELLAGNQEGSTLLERQRVLHAQNVQAVAAAQKTLASLKGVDAPAKTEKKHSLRKEVQLAGATAAKPLTLQARAMQFHVAVVNHLYRAYEWIVTSVSSIHGVNELFSTIKRFFSAVLNDAYKALCHVGSRMKEVKDAAPEGASIATNSAWSFGAWIVESWVRIGNYVLSLLEPVKAQWAVLFTKLSGVWDRFYSWSLAAKIEWWDGRVVYDKDIEDDVVIPGTIKVWYSNALTTAQLYKEKVLSWFATTPTDGDDSDEQSESQDGQRPSALAAIMLSAKAKIVDVSARVIKKITEWYAMIVAQLVTLKNRFFGVQTASLSDKEARAAAVHKPTMAETFAHYGSLALEKITHVYRVVIDFGVSLKNRYLPPLTAVEVSKKAQ